MNFRKGANGIIFAPRRGNPPDCPANYEPIPGDDFSFHPIIKCKYRKQSEMKIGCCTKTIIYQCSYHDCCKFQSECRLCKVRKC